MAEKYQLKVGDPLKKGIFQVAPEIENPIKYFFF